jgi:hypothetical protein
MHGQPNLLEFILGGIDAGLFTALLDSRQSQCYGNPENANEQEESDQHNANSKTQSRGHETGLP